MKSNKSDNVISIFSQPQSVTVKRSSQQGETDKTVFEDAIRRNLETRAKLQKERSKSNHSVLRSYRITKK